MPASAPAIASALAAAPAPAPAPVPPPVLAPYLGLVTSVLCAFAGGWLLLAPYALDFRRGAARLPRPAVVDLATGAAITAVALTSALLFVLALFTRLRPRPGPVASAAAHDVSRLEQELPEHATSEHATPEHATPEPGLEPDTESAPEAESEPTIDLTAAPEPDPSVALREMLTPLIAALATDLRRQDP